MENNPKIVAEQQYGKELYHKLRMDFKEELSQGKIVAIGLENLPKETLTNYQLGIAFEALSKEDYKTATSFFNNLGKEYSGLKAHAEKLWLEDRTKEEEQPQKTLVEKIESLKKPKIKFGYAQERIEEISKKHDLVREVMEGEITLIETVQQYQKELEGICKLKKKEFKDKITEYQTKLEALVTVFQEFTNPNINLEQNLEKPSSAKKIAGNAIMATSPLTLIGGIALAAVTLPATALGAGLVASFLTTVGFCTHISGGALLGHSEGMKKYKIEMIFRNLERYSTNIDNIIHQAFLTDFYLKDSEVFKNTFQKLNEEEQRYVLSQLLKKKEKNVEVDPWLIENYSTFIEEEGRFNIAVE